MIRTINQCKRLYRNVKCNEDANVKCITYETASHNMNMNVNQKSFVMYFHNHTVTPNFTTEKIESVGEGSWFGKIKHNYWWGADSPLLTITVKNISEANIYFSVTLMSFISFNCEFINRPKIILL